MPRRADRGRDGRRAAVRGSQGLLEALALFAVYLAALLVVYAPALRGPFFSDDLHYVATNPYVHALTLENLRQILDPASPASVFVVNYTPVHLLLHALAWRAFGPDVLGHHVLNLALHAAGSVLLVGVFRASGIGRLAALAGGTLFVLHPANVEAVAWISQTKTVSCFVLSMATLLLFPKRPGLATPAFFLALLAKPTGAFLLPVAGMLAFVRLWRGAPPWRHLVWLGVWVVGFLVVSIAQIEVNRRSGSPDAGLGPEGLERIPLVFGIALRYLWMSATSLGVSAFHEPPKHASFADPAFLASIPILAVCAVRAVRSVIGRREEAVYWVLAASSFAPISQIFPFLYPMADRYLYFILPGLIGVALFVLRDVEAALPAALREQATRAAIALALVLCIVFAVRGHARAELFGNPALLLVDAARNYPGGVSANLLRARGAAREGDVRAAIEALEAARARGWNRFEQLENDPVWDPIRSDPRFRGLVREIAAWWIERSEQLENPTQMELRVRAIAHLARGERDLAIESLEAALALGGPIDERIREELAELRRGSPQPSR
ncbi:hypothetical protein MYXO_01314 [Myxococcaceae bacterium]|nr:hypothetical protein MYXO_01314 [Myxococcaceae bacterium]